MDNTRLPSQDSATGRALKTVVQAMVGFIVGLMIVIWAVPGVPEAVIDYVTKNLPQVLLLVGVPSGITSFAMNAWRKDVKNY